MDDGDLRVSVGGLDVKCRVAGPDNGGPLFLLVHGTAGGMDRNFPFLFPTLALRHRVAAFDFADSGNQLELDHLVAQVSGVIDAVAHAEQVMLVGFSLGAVVAAAAAAKLGDRAGGLVLIAGWAKTDNHQRFRNKIWQQLYLENPDLAKEFMVGGAFSPAFMAMRTVEDVAAIAQGMELTPFVQRQMELNARTDLSDELERVSARTLIIGCKHDMTAPVHHSKALFGAIENACYTEVDSGHAVFSERPAEVLDLIEQFVSNPAGFPAGGIIPPHRP